MMPIKQEKDKKVVIIKDTNMISDTEKESQSQKEQTKKERIFLIQLIVVFLVWMFLLYLVMDKNPKKIILIFLIFYLLKVDFYKISYFYFSIFSSYNFYWI